MSRLFTCGIEEGEVGTNITMWTSKSAGASAVTTTPHSGDYCLQLSGTSGKAISRTFQTFLTEGTTLFQRFYWRTNNVAIADSRLYSNKSNTAVTAALITKLNGGVIRLTNSVASTTDDSNFSVSADTWYRFELDHFISDTTGTLTLRIYAGDSTTALDTLATASGDTMPVNIAQFLFEETANSASLTYLFDDIAVNNASGSAPYNTTPGPGKTYLATVLSNTSVSWESNGATSDDNSATFANIDDLPGTPDDTNYNTTHWAGGTPGDDALSSSDRFAMNNLGVGIPSNAVMKTVDVYARVGSNQTSSTSMRLKIWDEAGTLTNGPAAGANVNGWQILPTNQHLVYDATGKTKVNLDSFSLGYENITDVATRERRISAIWANVEWLESPGQTLAVDSGIYTSTGVAMLPRLASPLYLRHRK